MIVTCEGLSIDDDFSGAIASPHRSEKFNSWTSDQLISQIGLIKRCKTCRLATASWEHVWCLDVKLPEKSVQTPIILSRAKKAKKETENLSLASLVNEQYQGSFGPKSDFGLCSVCDFEDNVLSHNFARLPSILAIKMKRVPGVAVTIEPNITLNDLDGQSREYRLVVCVDRTINGFGVIVLDNGRMARIVDDTVTDPLSSDLATEYMNSGELFWFVSKEAH